MTLSLSWRQPQPAIVTLWRGPLGSNPPSALAPLAPPILAAIIGPPGAPGTEGAAGASPLTGELTIMLPSGEGVSEHQSSHPAPGVTPGMTVFAALKPTPDTHENDPELADIASLAARAESGSIRVTLACFAPMSGPILLQWSAF
jgi:hypothetical protein